MKAITTLVLLVSAIVAVNADQFTVLMEFYKQTNGPKWSKSNWGGSANNVCNWDGITCGTDGSVTEISLEANGLGGSLPPSLGSLKSLTVLDLAYNQIGGAIPESLSNLNNLKILSLGSNRFEGVIPESFGNLTNLQTLDLSKNFKLKGTIPESFGNFGTLTSFAVGSNMLTGAIPPSMGNITTIQYLDLSNNMFTGSFPDGWFSLNLVQCNLANNRIQCPIPKSCLGQCVN